MTVVTAMASERVDVSSPIFSACIRGRFHMGTQAMSERARTAVSFTFMSVKRL